MPSAQDPSRYSLKVLLSPFVEAQTLTDAENHMKSVLEYERGIIREMPTKGAPTSMDELRERIKSLRSIQAVFRALLRRFRHQVYESSPDPSASSSRGGGPGHRNSFGQNFEAVVAETETMIGGYNALAAIYSLQASSPGEIQLDYLCYDLEVSYTAYNDGHDFALVKDQVLSEVYGMDESGEGPGGPPRTRAPLDYLLGPWWRFGDFTNAREAPKQLLTLGEAIWIPHKVFVHKYRDLGRHDISQLAKEVQKLRLIVLYALVDAYFASTLGREVTNEDDMRILREQVAGPFSVHLGISTSDSLACLAHWLADGKARMGADELVLASGLAGENQQEKDGGRSYRQLLWTLAYQEKYTEAAHLLDVAPPINLTPLDGCLVVGVLLGLGQWQQAFVRQRNMASWQGPLATLPPRLRLAPLKLLAHRLVESRRIQWLTSLPLSPMEEQHIISTLYQSSLITRDHALLALLLRRRQFARAWAMYSLVEADIPEDRPSAQVVKENLSRLIEGIERFIPQEELLAMRKARDGGALEALEIFANFSPLPDDEGATGAAAAAAATGPASDDVDEEGMAGGAGVGGEGGRAPLRRPTYKAPIIPGAGGVSSSGGLSQRGGAAGAASSYYPSPSSLAQFDPSPLKRAGGRRDDMMDTDLNSPPAASLYYYDPVPGAPTPEKMRRHSGGSGGRPSPSPGAGVGGSRSSGAASRIRSPPVALRPGWSSRRDSFGGGGTEGGSSSSSRGGNK